jgi:hypothetical protein
MAVAAGFAATADRAEPGMSRTPKKPSTSRSAAAKPAILFLSSGRFIISILLRKKHQKKQNWPQKAQKAQKRTTATSH